MNKNHLMKLAREASFNADYTGCGKPKIGCVATLKGTVIAKGWNGDKTHTFQDKYNVYRYKDKWMPSKCHAEIAALSKIKYLDVDFSKVELFIYRELKDGNYAMARPCPSCMAAIKDFGIKKVHYTTPDGVATEKIGEKIEND